MPRPETLAAGQHVLLCLLLLPLLGLQALHAQALADDDRSDSGNLLWLRSLHTQAPGLADASMLNAQLRNYHAGGPGTLSRPRWQLHAEATLWWSAQAQSWTWLQDTDAASARRLDLQHWRIRPRSAGGLQVDWAYVQGQDTRWRYSLGRQPLSLGLGRLWSPSDLHAPFLPTDLERLYKPGVDAALLEVYLNTDWSTTTLLSARRAPSQGTRQHLQQRVSWQLTQGNGFFGVGRQGQESIGVLGQQLNNLAGWDVYADVLLHHSPSHGPASADPGGAGQRLLLGATRRLDARKLLTLEMLRQTRPLAEDLPRLGLGRHHLAASLSWELHPLLQLDVLTLHSHSDGSSQGLAGLKWQAREGLEIRATYSQPLGGRPSSEFRQQGRLLQLSALIQL